MSRIVVRHGPIRQCLAAETQGQVALGVVSGIAWRKAGFDWATTQEQGWREATARLRDAALATGATAVVNVRYRLSGDNAALGFLLSGDAIKDAGMSGMQGLPCVPFGQPALHVMRHHGLRPLGFAVGLFASDDFVLDYDPVLAGWGSGELSAFTDWKGRAREAALGRLMADPQCAAWTGSLDHRESVSLQVIRCDGLVWAVRLRVAVSRLGFQRHPGVLAPPGQSLLRLDDTPLVDIADRPVFYGITDETVVQDDADAAEPVEFVGSESSFVPSGFCGESSAETAPDNFSTMTNNFGFDDNSDSFGSSLDNDGWV